MLCLHNACGIFRKFSWLYYLYLQIWNWWVIFYIHETFLVYKLETFAICKEVKHIMLILLLYFTFLFLWDIWSTVENYFQKILSPRPSPWKSPPHTFLLTPPLKIQKSASLPLFPKIENFSGTSYRKGEWEVEVEGRTLCIL